jgi:hypothetical protein
MSCLLFTLCCKDYFLTKPPRSLSPFLLFSFFSFFRSFPFQSSMMTLPSFTALPSPQVGTDKQRRIWELTFKAIHSTCRFSFLLVRIPPHSLIKSAKFFFFVFPFSLSFLYCRSSFLAGAYHIRKDGQQVVRRIRNGIGGVESPSTVVDSPPCSSLSFFLLALSSLSRLPPSEQGFVHCPSVSPQPSNAPTLPPLLAKSLISTPRLTARRDGSCTSAFL